MNDELIEEIEDRLDDIEAVDQELRAASSTLQAGLQKLSGEVDRLQRIQAAWFAPADGRVQ